MSALTTISACSGTSLIEKPRATVDAELSSSCWVLSADQKSLSRSFRARNWKCAIAFINAVSELAEEAQHHPDLHLTNWRDVYLELSTHSKGGLTQLDIELAKKIDTIPVDYSKQWLDEQRVFQGNESPVAFDQKMYAKGLNADFLVEDRQALMDEFAGGEAGGGGKFEDSEQRDIAKAKDYILNAFTQYCGLTSDATVADLGAGTGLFEVALAAACAKLYAVELSPVFRQVLADRCAGLNNVHIVSNPTDTDPMLPRDSVDLALLIDVYHHLEYPKTFLANVRNALKRHGALCIIDFHRDPERVTSRGPEWVLAHVRADQTTFTNEITAAGFTLVKDLPMASLPENYFLVFRKRPLPLATPGAGWA